MTPDRAGERGEGRDDRGPRESPHQVFAMSAAMAEEERRRRRRAGPGVRLRFRIQHMMWLSLWSALVLAAREPLMASLPAAVAAIVVLSGVVAVGLLGGLYGVALMAEEGERKDQAVLVMLYCLTGDLFLFLMFLLLEARQ